MLMLRKSCQTAVRFLLPILLALLGRQAAAQFARPLPPPPTRQPIYSPVEVTTYHNDTARTGENLNEHILNPANVGSGMFGKLFTVNLDGYVYAQPLYLSHLSIFGQGFHNTVFAATENNSLYAIDADTGAVLWQDNFGPAVPNYLLGTNDIVPQVGITGTPVINPNSGVIYLVAKTDFFGNISQTLYAVNVHTGSVRTAVTLAARLPGTGDASQYGWVSFSGFLNNQRPALLLLNGNVYVGFSSHGDNGPYHGWLLRYDANTLRQTGAFCTTPNGISNNQGLAAGGIWMGGSGPSADPLGNIYVTTGNGTFDGAKTTFPNNDFGDSVLKLSTWGGVRLLDYFTPFDQAALQAYDIDLGSGGALVLPPEMGVPGHPSLLLAIGKEGRLYLMDRNNLGKYNPSGDQIVQEVSGTPQSGVWGIPAYCNGTIYIGGQSDVIRAYAYVPDSTGAPVLTQTAQGQNTFYYPGTTPTVSALLQNGQIKNAIVWALDVSQYNNPNGQSVLYAYDPDTLAMLYSSDTNNEDPGGPVKFTVPTVANGKVYVGAQRALSVYGLKQP